MISKRNRTARKTRKFEPRAGSVAAEIIAARRAEGEGAWHTVTLPKPPSANNLYLNPKGGKGRRPKAPRLRQWLKVASYAVLASRPPRINAEYELRIELGRRKGSDLGNYEKAISDLLKNIGVIRDDSLSERITLEWADDLASSEARVSIRPRARTIATAEPKKRKRKSSAADLGTKSERMSAAAYRDLLCASPVSRSKQKAMVR